MFRPANGPKLSALCRFASGVSIVRSFSIGVSALGHELMSLAVSTPWFSELDRRICALGGYFNAHLHLDRAGTYGATCELFTENESGSHLSLPAKHGLIPALHRHTCYTRTGILRRVEPLLVRMADAGTTRADTVVDVTDDGLGLTGFHAMSELSDRISGKMSLRLGAYTPLGFRDDEPGRWTLLREAAEKADFIGSLPERDDHARYPKHVGFDESCRRMLALSDETGKDLHIHADQQNLDRECATERIVELIEKSGTGGAGGKAPRVWVVHAISPSRYEESRFNELVERLASSRIGVICCPSAAISMRQVRSIPSPTGNSIARVLELLAGGVEVRIGSDNICDITSPAGVVDLLQEIFVLANALRFYDMDILARVAAGHALGADERAAIKRHLERDREAAEEIAAKYAAGGPIYG